MKIKSKDLSIAGLLIAVGIILPIAFHSFGGSMGGQIFLPMHIPILIGGFLLPLSYACIIGAITPLLSFLFTSMPPIPTVFVMMAELFAYGLFTPFFHRKLKFGIYQSLILSMLIGRVISILSNWIIIGTIMGKPFGFTKVLYGLFVVGLPGIAIQLVLIPILVRFLLSRLEKR